MNKLIASIVCLVFSASSLEAISEKDQLQIAIDDVNVADVQQLLNKDPRLANAIFDSQTKKTALHWAAIGGSHDQANNDIITALLDKGADINAKDKAGATPLWDATEAGMTDVVKLLLKNGADRNIKGSQGRTPLDVAKSTNNSAIIALLTGAPGTAAPAVAQPSVTTFTSAPAAQPSTSMVTPIVAQPAQKSMPITSTSRASLSDDLQGAIASGNLTEVKNLLAQDSSLVNKEIKGMRRYPLNLAVATNQLDVVQVLLNGGANKDLTDAAGKTPLELAQGLNGLNGRDFTEIINLLSLLL